MRVQKVAYLLIFLALWSQFDDALLAGFLTIPCDQLADDDDEYLSVERGQDQTRSSTGPKSLLVRWKPENAGGSISTRRDSPAATKDGLIGLFHLYIFMSLQL
jgi:hypothetical protein